MFAEISDPRLRAVLFVVTIIVLGACAAFERANRSAKNQLAGHHTFSPTRVREDLEGKVYKTRMASVVCLITAACIFVAIFANVR